MRLSPSFMLIGSAGLASAFPNFHPSLHPVHQLYRRALSWVQPGTERAASSVCANDHATWINEFQIDAGQLATAAYYALDQIVDSFGEMATWVLLSQADRSRIMDTYTTFFGMWDDDEENFPQSEIDRIDVFRRILGYISGLAPEAYPDTLRIGCDSSHLQDRDPDGNDIYKARPNTPPPPPGKVYKYDDDGNPEDFAEWLEWLQCDKFGEEYPAYTTGWPGRTEDRMTLCPHFWTTSLSLMHQKVGEVQDGQSHLSMFTRVGSKVFYHELLHAVSITGQQWGSPDKMDDVEGQNSYGPWNANRIATADRSKAFRNIENLVWFSVAMFASEYDWSTLIAKKIA